MLTDRGLLDKTVGIDIFLGQQFCCFPKLLVLCSIRYYDNEQEDIQEGSSTYSATPSI